MNISLDLIKKLRLATAAGVSDCRQALEDAGGDYEKAKKLRPDIIYVSQSGWGQKGPRAMFRSFGMMAFAHSGIAYLSGLPGRPAWRSRSFRASSAVHH